MKKILAIMLMVALSMGFILGCKTDKPTDFPECLNNEFYTDVAYVGFAQGSGATISGVDFPVPSGITFKLWHMVKADGTAYIGTKIEEKILWFIPLEYGQHIWRVRPGEWDNPGAQLAKAWDWANALDKGWGSKVKMDRAGHGAAFRRQSDGYVEGFGSDYQCWIPQANSMPNKPQSNSAEQIHWVHHIYDETTFWPNSAGMWANVHGFQEASSDGADGSWVYWVGFDIRTIGIRSADYVIRCKNKATYDEYIYEAFHNPTGLLHKMRSDSRLNYSYGSDVNVEFIFKWGDDDKSFDVHLGTDSYAWEK